MEINKIEMESNKVRTRDGERAGLLSVCIAGVTEIDLELKHFYIVFWMSQ